MNNFGQKRPQPNRWNGIIRGAGLICTCAIVGLAFCSSAIGQSNNSGDPDTDEEVQGGYITASFANPDVALSQTLNSSGTIYENDGDPDSEDSIAVADDASNRSTGSGTVGLATQTYIDGDFSMNFSSADAPDQRIIGHVHKPTGEKLSDDGWVGPTLRVDSIILPTTFNFTGITVAETNGTGSKDSCYYTGATGQVPYDHLAGPNHTWFVSTNNDMGDDLLSWGDAAITFYRSHGRATCGTILAQNMSVVVPNPHQPVQYTSHTIKLFIGKTVLTNVKDTISDTTTY